MYLAPHPKRSALMIELIKQHPIWSGSLSASMIFSLRLLLGLWMLPRHKETGILKKLFWSIAVLIPFMGPLFYGAFYRVPKSHRGGGAQVNSDAFYGGFGGM